MKICLLGKTCDPKTGGIGRHIFELADRLDERDHEVTIVVKEGEKNSDLDVDFVEVKSLDYGPEVLSNYSSAIFILNYLWNNGSEFDIVHGHEVYGSLGYLLKERCSFDFVYTVHGVAYELISRSFLKPLAKILHFPERLSVRSSDNVVAVSENTRRETIEHYGVDEEKIKTVYNGVDTGRFRPVKDFDNQLLFVGYFIERKGSDLVLDAFANIADDFPDLDLKFVGKGRMEEDLRETVQREGLDNRVDFLSDVSDEELVELYSSSVFVMPSAYEGQGIVYVEALSCGSPAIGCDNSAIPEMINDGENGFLVERDVESLENAFRKIISDKDLREEMSSNARSSAMRFDWERIAEKTEKLYKSLI